MKILPKSTYSIWTRPGDCYDPATRRWWQHKQFHKNHEYNYAADRCAEPPVTLRQRLELAASESRDIRVDLKDSWRFMKKGLRDLFRWPS